MFLPKRLAAGLKARKRVVMSSAQIKAVAARSVRGVIRQPQAWVPSLAFPLFFTALSSAAFEKTRAIPGFPEVSSFVAFLLAATILQGVMFGSTSAGTDVAIDIESGFFDRFLASPISRLALVFGRLAGTILLAAIQALLFIIILMCFGATMKGGIPGLAVTLLVAGLLGGAVGAFAVTVGLRTGSVEAVNGFFPIFFALVFLSSAFFPPQISGGWFEVVAGVNPLSTMVDGMRHLHIVGWDFSKAASAVVVSAVLFFVFVGTSLVALSLRIKR
ncbi:MAG: ABC-2 type transport system permease protein [Candidatus Poriferisodalaceae bacterium]|jgi:ABC-2 type transport system permease protein